MTDPAQLQLQLPLVALLLVLVLELALVALLLVLVLELELALVALLLVLVLELALVDLPEQPLAVNLALTTAKLAAKLAASSWRPDSQFTQLGPYFTKKILILRSHIQLRILTKDLYIP